MDTLALPQAPDWHAEGNCVTLPRVDINVFHPRPESARTDIRKAKAICNGCPVTNACLDYALSIEDNDGVFAGLTGEERARLVRS